MISPRQIVLTDFPIPNSINQQWQISSHGRRMIKSKEARAFDDAVFVYGLKNKTRLLKISDMVKTWLLVDEVISVDCHFVLERRELYTKKNEIKSLDQNNFLKSSLDAVAKLIDVDDKYFFSNTCTKVQAPPNGIDRQAIIVIKPMAIKTLEVLLSEIKN